MQLDLTVTIIIKLVVAAFLGGLVGIERQLRQKPAGLRTNIFICLGSALFTILSEQFAADAGGDHTRIASQLIPGIGFIGAGAIIRDRGSVVGLTTAATIFVVASIGMAVGAGMYWTAVFTSVMVVLTLSFLGWVEDRFSLKTRRLTFRLTTANLESAMSHSTKTLQQMGLEMQHFQLSRAGSDIVLEFDADVSYTQERELVEKLGTLEARCQVVPRDTARE